MMTNREAKKEINCHLPVYESRILQLHTNVVMSADNRLFLISRVSVSQLRQVFILQVPFQTPSKVAASKAFNYLFIYLFIYLWFCCQFFRETEIIDTLSSQWISSPLVDEMERGGKKFNSLISIFKCFHVIDF